MKGKTPVLAIALDAAEVSLIERLCQEGELRTLSSLRNQGCFGTLESSEEVFTGEEWPTFYTCQQLPWHGMYAGKLNGPRAFKGRQSQLCATKSTLICPRRGTSPSFRAAMEK